MSYSQGDCSICRERKDFLMPLHHEEGGPMCCMMCCGKWHAEHGRRRKLGRIVIRAIRAFLDGGGRYRDIDNLARSATFAGEFFGIDPLGYLAGISKTKDEIIELTSELLDETLKLVHPDMQPPERSDLAHKVTQGLLALKPFVFPAPKPKPAPMTPPRYGSSVVPPRNYQQAVTYPCPECADTTPYYYCTACRAEWDKRQAAKREREAKKRREYYARRKRRLAWQKPPTQCVSCGTKFKGKRKDARFCSSGCRQRAHRQNVRMRTLSHESSAAPIKKAPLNSPHPPEASSSST